MKIISGAQTGVDRAALDAAIELGIEYGGSIPKGRLAEDGPIDKKYFDLVELEAASYSIRTEKNVKDADATLIFTVGRLTGGTAFTKDYARKHHKPHLVIDLEDKEDMDVVLQIREWLSNNQPEILNIAGPRESMVPGIYQRVFNILSDVFDFFV